MERGGRGMAEAGWLCGGIVMGLTVVVGWWGREDGWGGGGMRVASVLGPGGQAAVGMQRRL